MNLLIITHQYPNQTKDKSSSTVIHEFAESFNSLGYNIHVLNIRNNYWWIKYLPKYVRSLIEAKFDKRIHQFYEKSENINKTFRIDRIPIQKGIIRINSKKNLKKVFNEVLTRLNEVKFIPDFIMVHWEDPYSYLGNKISNHFNVPASIVIHNIAKLNRTKIVDSVMLYKNIGFRSERIKSDFLDLIKDKYHYSVDSKNLFLCPSGIEMDPTERLITGNITTFIFAGSLIKRKYPHIIPEALDRANFSYKKLTYCGDGYMGNKIRKLKNNKIQILGWVPRKRVLEELNNSDCFIMVSKNETFGLVYLEAMIRGLIVIAGEKEGMQGIIIDGFNGFTAKPGDKDALIRKLNIIQRLTPKEIIEIKTNAMNTAKKYDKKEIAKNYLKALSL